MLKTYYNKNMLEVGIDEAGRGPMLGRVYTAAVILPKDLSFNHSWMKDSKRFTSSKKDYMSTNIYKAYQYIKQNAIGLVKERIFIKLYIKFNKEVLF